jgi:hypothetical protein
MTDTIEILGNHTADVRAEIKYRVIERLGILYEDKPVTEDQIAAVVKQVEAELI